MSRVIETWARILGSNGHRAIVVSQASPSARPFPPMAGVEMLTHQPALASSRLGRLLGARRRATELLTALIRERPLDLCIAQDSIFSSGFRQSISNVPLLQTFHSPFVDENRLNNWKYTTNLHRLATYPFTCALAWRFERSALSAVSAAHTLSDYTWRILSSRHPRLARRTRWQKIPGAFDQRRFHPARDRAAVRAALGLEPDALVLLTVRRIVPRNAVERVVDAAAALRGQPRPLKFLIGGTGVLIEPLRKRVAEQHLDGLVEILGFIPEDRLAAYYQAADAFLLPTRDLECFGLPVIEAMACGCTPLVMPDGGPEEICAPYPGSIASANTTTAFTALVADYIAGRIPQRIDGISEETSQRYSEATITEPILRLVEEVASR